MIPEVMEQMFRVLPDIVFCVKDCDQVYRSVNPAFAERLGLKSEADIIGRRAEDVFPADLAAVYDKQDREVLQKGVAMVDRLELITNRDGSLGWYLASKFPLNDESGELVGLISISRDLQTPSVGDLKMVGMQRIVDWLAENLDQEVKTADLAKIAGMSSSQLERRMKRVFKLGVAQFVRKMRIEKAVQLLKSTDKPLIEIALCCGYSEQSSLTRQFKSAVGCPPGEYRRRLSASDSQG